MSHILSEEIEGNKKKAKKAKIDKDGLKSQVVDQGALLAAQDEARDG